MTRKLKIYFNLPKIVQDAFKMTFPQPPSRSASGRDAAKKKIFLDSFQNTTLVCLPIRQACWAVVYYLVILLNLVFICFFPKPVFAEVVINEFLPKSSQEWVEFYNKGPLTEDLSNYFFDDDNDFNSDSGSSPKFKLAGILAPGTTCYWNVNSYLNDNGDTPTLFYSDGNLVDSYSYTTTVTDKSYSRIPYGGDWQSDQEPSKSAVECLSLVPSLTPTLTPTLTPPTPTLTPRPTSTPTLTPTPLPKAIYKINKPKDQNGVELSGVKIYVDDLYIHHQDNEILTFCSGCHCDDDKNVDCELGTHIIRLEKEGYKDWQETKTFNIGDNFEANPILIAISPQPTSTSVPPSATPTLTPKLSPSPFFTPTPEEITGEVLGQEEEATSPDKFYLSKEKLDLADESKNIDLSSPNKEIKEKSHSILPWIFIVIGAGFIVISLISFFKNQQENQT